MSLDYLELVKKSLKNAWEYKFLWLFGFFVVGSDYSGMFNWMGRLPDRHEYSRHFDFEGIRDLRDLADVLPFGLDLKTVLAFMFAAVLLWLFLLIMSFLSEGALIHGVSKKRLGEKVSFGNCWAKGVDMFWRMVVILVLLGIAIFACVIFMVLILIPAFIAHPAFGLIVMLVIFLPVLFAVIFVIESVAAWSIRIAVLDNIPCIDALGKGWQMFRENLGRSFGVGLSSTIVQIVVAIATIIVIIMAAVPFIIVGTKSPAGAIVMGLPVLLIILVAVSVYMGVFKSSIWTLAFMELTGKVSADTPNEIGSGDAPASALSTPDE